MYLLWLYILITIIWKNYSKVLLVRLIVWYIINEKRCNTVRGYSFTVYPISFVWHGGIYKSKKHLEHKISSQGIPNIWESSGFFFPYWIFILLFALNNLLNTGFVTKHGLIHQIFFYHICILENCVSVVSMIGYFPYINILSSKEIEYLP